MKENAWHDVASGNLSAVRWEPDGSGRTGRLRILFLSGRTYRYEGVPRDVWLALMHAPSKGEYHAANIKWAFPYRQE